MLRFPQTPDQLRRARVSNARLTSTPDIVSRQRHRPLSAQLRRPRPRSATRALRRHETFHDRPAVLRERRAQGGALLPPTPCSAPFGLSLYGLAIRAIIWWNGLSDCSVFGVFVGDVSLNSPGGGDVGVAARPDRLSSAWRDRAHTRSPPAWDLSSTPRRNRRWPRRGCRAADRGSRGCLDCRRSFGASPTLASQSASASGRSRLAVARSQQRLLYAAASFGSISIAWLARCRPRSGLRLCIVVEIFRPLRGSPIARLAAGVCFEPLKPAPGPHRPELSPAPVPPLKSPLLRRRRRGRRPSSRGRAPPPRSTPQWSPRHCR